MLPSLVKHLIYPFHERLLSRPTFSRLAELENSQWLNREELENLQLERLGTLLKSALLHCPWHAGRLRGAGLDLPEIAALGWDDFRRLPTMGKADAKRHGDEIVWHGVPGGTYRYTTGGSSGEPLIFHFGKTRQAADQAGRIRSRRWWGVDVGDREVYLWGAPVELNKTDRIKTLRDRLFNQRVLNAFEMSPGRMDEYLASISAFRPSCLYGYASSLALLAAHGRARGVPLRLPCLKVVCTTGEPLYPHQRQLIGEYFGVPVANEFGSRDVGFTAHETPDGEMLLFSEGIVLEVLDPQGRPVAPGEAGEAVMTGLNSEAQPFIRYRTGDMVRLSPNPGTSGRGLHVIEEVIGRQTDFLVKADGTVMHALAAIYILRGVAGVGEFRVIQHTTRHVEVEIVTGESWRPEAKPEIVRQFRQRLGEAVTVTIREVEGILPEASGKYRYVVSHVPLPSALQEASRQTS